MSPVAVGVLLVGKSAMGCSFLLEHLRKQGCDCRVATSSPEAARLSGGHSFNLVLCTGQMDGINELIASFIGSPATVFRCHPVEDSSWWMPTVCCGEECISTPALRPSEFAAALDRIVDAIKSGKTPLQGMNLTGDGCWNWYKARAPRVAQAGESPVEIPRGYLPRRTAFKREEDQGQI